MFFDHKTRQYIGDLTEVAPEELERELRLVEEGVLRSTRHPSKEKIAAMNEIFSRRNVEKEVAEAFALAKKDRERRRG